VTTSTDVSIRHTVAGVVDHVVDGVPGVTGALIATADGFVVAARLPDGLPFDAAALSAMSAATLALAGRLVGAAGATAVEVSAFRSADAQVIVFAIGASAVLTVLADRAADSARIERIGREVSLGLARAFASPT
jgi:hypothetical protein